VPGQPADRRRHVAEDEALDALAEPRVDRAQVPRAAGHQGCPGQRGQRGGARPAAVPADDRQHGLTHPGTVAATTVRPVKSTIATSASTAPAVNAVST
jgi:hypothetical protein